MAEADARWQEHYTGVFGGHIVDKSHVREPPRDQAMFSCTLEVGPVATEESFAALGNGKGVGLDQIPAEVLKAGGAPLACKYSEVNMRVAENHSWPSQWRGGRLVSVYKQKSDPPSTCTSA